MISGAAGAATLGLLELSLLDLVACVVIGCSVCVALNVCSLCHIQVNPQLH